MKVLDDNGGRTGTPREVTQPPTVVGSKLLASIKNTSTVLTASTPTVDRVPVSTRGRGVRAA